MKTIKLPSIGSSLSRIHAAEPYEMQRSALIEDAEAGRYYTSGTHLRDCLLHENVVTRRGEDRDREEDRSSLSVAFQL